MAQKSKKGLYIGIGIITVAVIASIIVYYYTIVKPKSQQSLGGGFGNLNSSNTSSTGSSGSTGSGGSSSGGSSSGGSSSGASGGGSTGMTNSTLLEWKSPIMIGDRVQWVQNAYNNVAKARQNKLIQPNWPIIVDDGKFGENTHKAVNRVMGKYKTTWTEFKAKTDQMLAQINGGGGSTNPYFWTQQ